MIGENESLIKYSKKTDKKTVNKQALTSVINHYKDKFKIDNKIRVKFVDGLSSEGQTVAAKNTGKTAKNLKNKIDKQKLKIRQLEDKITQLEGGNAGVSDPLDVLNEQLRVAKSELKDLETFLPDIDITIDLNAKNPYATLRSELEHANDIAHNRVPNDENHFSRYQGRNEGEVAQGFVKHKADRKKEILSGGDDVDDVKPVNTKELEKYKVKTSRDSDFGENPDINEHDYEPYTIHSLENTNGEKLGHIRVTDSNYIDWSSNHNIEKGAVRKLIAKLLYEGKYDTLKWEAISESSVKSYQYFCKEYPDLVDKIQFTDKWSKIDSKPPSIYNSEKGVINEGSQSSKAISERGEVLRTDGISSNSQEIHATGTNKRPNRTDKSGVLDESNPAANERRKITNTNNESRLQPTNGRTTDKPEQLKLDLDFSTVTPQQAAEAVVNGKSADVGDIAAMVDNIIKNDEKLSSFKWKDIADNADMKEQLVKMLSDKDVSQDLSKAYLNGDVETVANIMSKQLAANKAISLLYDQLQDLGLNATKEQRKAIISFVGVKRCYYANFGNSQSFKKLISITYFCKKKLNMSKKKAKKNTE